MEKFTEKSIEEFRKWAVENWEEIIDKTFKEEN